MLPPSLRRVSPRAPAAIGLAAALALAACQEAAPWRARFAGKPEEAAAALAAVPATLDAELAEPIARLLQSQDPNLRNAAAAWLCARPRFADAVLPVLAELRRSDDPDVARAAGGVFTVLAPQRPLSLDELREQLRDHSRLHHAIERLAAMPEAESQLLPFLLDLHLANIDLVLQRVRQREPQRLRTELLASLDRPGDTAGRIRWLGSLGPLDGEALARIDAEIAGETRDGRAAAITLVTQAIAAGAPPPPHWLAVLRRDDGNSGRQVLFGELIRHPFQPRLWPEIAPLLPEDPAGCPGRLLLDLGRSAKDHAEDLRTAMERGGAAAMSSLGPVAAELAPATRGCAPLLLPSLRVNHRETVQVALHCLGALGNDSPAVLDAIAACLDDADEEIRLDALVALGRLGAATHRATIVDRAKRAADAFATLADFVVTTFAADARTSDALFDEVNGADMRRALVAAHALTGHAIDPIRLVKHAQSPRSPNANDWWSGSMRRHIERTLLGRLTPCAVDRQTALEANRLTGRLPVQDALRVFDWLAQSGTFGTEALAAGLASRFVGPTYQHHVLAVIAARGAEFASLAPSVAPFVHHPEFAVRQAAIDCLTRIAGPEAVAAARLQPDPWRQPAAVAAPAGRGAAEKR